MSQKHTLCEINTQNNLKEKDDAKGHCRKCIVDIRWLSIEFCANYLARLRCGSLV